MKKCFFCHKDPGKILSRDEEKIPSPAGSGPDEKGVLNEYSFFLKLKFENLTEKVYFKRITFLTAGIPISI